MSPALFPGSQHQTAVHLHVSTFVVGFSSLRPLEKQLRDQFDHTFLVNHDDPLLEQWRSLHKQGALDLRVMKNVGMENTAQLLWTWANELLIERDLGRCCCWKVEARENVSNEATYSSVPNWFDAVNLEN